MILKADKSKIADAVSLALKLWSGHSEKELAEELSPLAEGENGCIFIEYAEEKPIGFARCQMRNDYVEGSSSSPTAYLEGIYVEPTHRKQGVARRLLSVHSTLKTELKAVKNGQKKKAAPKWAPTVPLKIILANPFINPAALRKRPE